MDLHEQFYKELKNREQEQQEQESYEAFVAFMGDLDKDELVEQFYEYACDAEDELDRLSFIISQLVDALAKIDKCRTRGLPIPEIVFTYTEDF